MMRKDVKLGFAIGGVLLAVLVVYVLVVSGSDPASEPVSLATGDTQTQTPLDNKTPEPAPAVEAPAEVASRNPATAPSQPPAETPPTDPFGTVASADSEPITELSKPQDPWAAALHQGNTPELMMSTTPVPTAPVVPVVSGGSTAGTSASGGVRANQPAPRISNDLTPAAPQSPSADSATSYTVQSGETFASIAAAKYGNAAYYSHLIRANPSIDPRKLRPGMVIKLPPASEVKAVVNTPSQEAAAPVDAKTEYRIASGDSLYKISMKLYGKPDRADKIYEANKAAIGSDPAKLKLGMVLKLPEPPTVK
jgi:nucleoid-associated protein YgaU